MSDLPKELNFDNPDQLYRDLLSSIEKGEISIEDGQINELDCDFQLSDLSHIIIIS